MLDPFRGHLLQKITARKASYGIWFREKSVDTETLPKCVGIWGLCFLIVNEWDALCCPLEGKPWTAVWERCQRMRNKTLASVPAILQMVTEQSRDLAGVA